MTGGFAICVVRVGHGILHLPCRLWEIKGSAPVCVWPLCPGAVSVLSCEYWVSPHPRKYGVTQDPHSSEFASVIYAFVLLLGTPTLVCVLPTPGCLRGPIPVLSTQLKTPQRLCSSRRLLLASFSQGTPQSSVCLQTPALLPSFRA